MSNETLNEYWLNNYISDNHHCGLCGNHGIIKNMGEVKTPAGVTVTPLESPFCVCPNGQEMGKQARKHKNTTRGTCVVCGDTLTIPPNARGVKIYCSNKCSQKAKRKRNKEPKK